MPVPIPSAKEVISTLRAGHPRLLASNTDFASLKVRVSTDPQLKEWHAKLRDRGTRLLAEPPSQYEIPDGLRLLATSRRVMERVYTLALLYRLDGDKRFAERAWTELETAANFKDWNPRHFLDTSEMTHAF
ncbi:MAG: coagulation factor 5/8 type domain-containing protein, partial [Verrucomicrobia bacterium]|nr:coagulation factor 5/8 type domain-containing protein [Verrucomicrobiota bacterium]